MTCARAASDGCESATLTRGLYPAPMLALSEIARLEELRQAQGVASIADESVPFCGGIMARTHPGGFINHAIGAGLGGVVADAPSQVRNMIAFFEQHGIEPRIELSAYADASLVEALSAERFVVRLFECTFACELSPQNAVCAVHPPPRGLKLSVIDPKDQAAVREFAMVSCSGFMPPGQVLSEEDLAVPMRMASKPGCVSVIARLDLGRGLQAVGAGTLATGRGEFEKVAGLFGTSVVPEARRRGVQQALLAFRMNEAARRGAVVATIGSLPGAPTERNVRRMGFFPAYTKVHLVRPGLGLVPNMG